MSDFKSEQIKSVLKDLLKKKKLTYDNVAAELDCSVPTIKRILGPEELSLPRLLQLCDLVEINLSDLETLMQMNKDPEEKFTPAQEEFLAKNPHFLAYFINLFTETPQELAQRYELTDRTTDKYLIALEKMELIKVTGKLKVKPAFKKIPSLGHGVLAKAYYKNFINTGAKYFIQAMSDKLATLDTNDKEKIPQGFSMQTAKCTPSAYTQYVQDQNKARENFFKLAAYEEKTRPESELQMSVILHAFTCSPIDDKAIKILESSLGDIKNL